MASSWQIKKEGYFIALWDLIAVITESLSKCLEFQQQVQSTMESQYEGEMGKMGQQNTWHAALTDIADIAYTFPLNAFILSF